MACNSTAQGRAPDKLASRIPGGHLPQWREHKKVWLANPKLRAIWLPTSCRAYHPTRRSTSCSNVTTIPTSLRFMLAESLSTIKALKWSSRGFLIVVLPLLRRRASSWLALKLRRLAISLKPCVSPSVPMPFPAYLVVRRYLFVLAFGRGGRRRRGHRVSTEVQSSHAPHRPPQVPVRALHGEEVTAYLCLPSASARPIPAT